MQRRLKPALTYDSSTYTSDYIDLGADLSSADQTLSSGAQSPNAALTQYQIIEDADNTGTMYLYIGATDSAVSNIDFTDTDDFLAITGLAEIDTAIDVTDGDYLRAVDGTIMKLIVTVLTLIQMITVPLQTFLQIQHLLPT